MVRIEGNEVQAVQELKEVPCAGWVEKAQPKIKKKKRRFSWDKFDSFIDSLVTATLFVGVVFSVAMWVWYLVEVA